MDCTGCKRLLRFMTRFSIMRFPVLIMVACIATFDMSLQILAAAPPQYPPTLPPQPSGEELEQCWSPLVSVQGCVGRMYQALTVGTEKVNLGSPCCEAIGKISNSCWPEMFPLQPETPKRIKASCNPTPSAVAPK